GLMAAVLGRDDNGQLIRKAGIMGIVLVGGETRAGDLIRAALPPERSSSRKKRPTGRSGPATDLGRTATRQWRTSTHEPPQSIDETRPRWTATSSPSASRSFRVSKRSSAVDRFWTGRVANSSRLFRQGSAVVFPTCLEGTPELGTICLRRSLGGGIILPLRKQRGACYVRGERQPQRGRGGFQPGAGDRRCLQGGLAKRPAPRPGRLPASRRAAAPGRAGGAGPYRPGVSSAHRPAGAG